MNGLAVRDDRSRDDARDGEVALAGFRRTDADGLVGQLDGQRIRVRGRVDDDRANAHLAAGPEDAERDLPAVGDQNLLEHGSCARTFTAAGPFPAADLA